MKNFDSPFKHITKPLIPESVLDSLKPFREIQERHKLLFADAFRINEIAKAAFEPYQSLLKASIPASPLIEIPALNAFKSLNDSLSLNFADSFIKRNEEMAQLFSSSILGNLKASNILGQQFADAQKISSLSGIGVAASLKIFDETLFDSVSSIVNQFTIDPDLFKDLLKEAEEEKINVYSLRSIAEYLQVKAPELLNLENVVIFILSMVIQSALLGFWKEQIVAPNICVAKSGCRIRVDGTLHSDIKTAVPNGEEILVLEDHGKWKKVFWHKDTGETYEGWMSSSLMEWKYKNQLKED